MSVVIRQSRENVNGIVDCLPHNICNVGQCMKELSCNVVAHSQANYKGNSTTYGPYFFSEPPMGKFVDSQNDKHVDSVSISEGCAEVVLMDACGGCKENRDDNAVLNNHASSRWWGISNLPSDLQNGICGFKTHIKKSGPNSEEVARLVWCKSLPSALLNSPWFLESLTVLGTVTAILVLLCGFHDQHACHQKPPQACIFSHMLCMFIGLHKLRAESASTTGPYFGPVLCTLIGRQEIKTRREV